MNQKSQDIGIGNPMFRSPQSYDEDSVQPVTSVQKLGDLISMASELLTLLKQMAELIEICRKAACAGEQSIIPDVIYTEPEVCRFLKITRKMLREMISDGRIEGCSVPGNQYRIPGHNILSFLNEGSFNISVRKENFLCKKENSASGNFSDDFSETDS